MAPEPVTPGKPSLGKLLKKTRVAREKTQVAVERELGIDRSRLSAYENDRERPNLATLEKLAETIGLELPWEPGTGATGDNGRLLHIGAHLRRWLRTPSCRLVPPVAA